MSKKEEFPPFKEWLPRGADDDTTELPVVHGETPELPEARRESAGLPVMSLGSGPVREKDLLPPSPGSPMERYGRLLGLLGLFAQRQTAHKKGGLDIEILERVLYGLENLDNPNAPKGSVPINSSTPNVRRALPASPQTEEAAPLPEEPAHGPAPESAPVDPDEILFGQQLPGPVDRVAPFYDQTPGYPSDPNNSPV